MTLYLIARYGQDFRTAMNAAAQVSLAGDADTIPSMSGAILGALHGAQSLPAVWTQQLYQGNTEWKKQANYQEGVQEDFSPIAKGLIYVPVSEAKTMADELYSFSLSRP